MMLVPASNDAIQYVGRVDQSDPKHVHFSYPGVSIKAKFEGTVIEAIFEDGGTGDAAHTNYFNVIIDQNPPYKLKLNPSQSNYSLATKLSSGTHTVELIKITESAVGACTFRGFKIEKGLHLLPLEKTNTLKMEFIGASLNCGYGIEKSYPVPPASSGFHSEHENNYLSHGAITARNLNADYVCTAYSGRGLVMNNTGATHGTIPELYDFVIPDLNVPWKHEKYIPDIIVINLGTNDFAAEANNLGTIDAINFKTTYSNFIKKLHDYYPNANIICAVGCMMSDNYPVGKQHWTRIQSYVAEVVNEVKNNSNTKIHYLKFNTQKAPYGDDWHPTAKTQAEMAEVLTAFIKENQMLNLNFKF